MGQHRPASARLMQGLLLSITVCVGLLLSSQSILLIYLFPALALFLGWFLFRASPGLCTRFALWLWFISPLVPEVRRYFRSGSNAASPVLLAPYLASCVPLYFLVQR